MPTETFGQRLRRIRAEQRVSSDALAAAVGISGAAVRMMESGVTKQARLDVGVLLADALGVTPRYLVFGDGGPVVPRLATSAASLIPE